MKKIYISTDLEGASGVFKFAQTRDMPSPLFHQAMEYLMGDIAAVVRGLRDVGVDEILVLDGHNGGNNFIPHLMEPGARYITGAGFSSAWGLDRSVDGLIMLAYHAMCGTSDGVLCHTQSSKMENHYWYNGVESGELAQSAIIAGHFGVPPIMVSGDEATCREARRFFGKECVTVAVKRGLSREAAVLYPFEETRKALYGGAQRAVAAIAKCRPYKIKVPVKMKKQYIASNSVPSETRLVTQESLVKDVSDMLKLV